MYTNSDVRRVLLLIVCSGIAAASLAIVLDGCGSAGTVGPCYVNGHLACQTDDGATKVCGPDGCGGSCGTCPQGKTCNADGTACVTPAPVGCTNGVQDGQETDVDCGGPPGSSTSCKRCLLGRRCNVTSDCGPASQSGEGVDCLGHVCACMTGFADCDGNAETGCEVGLGNDPKNCGACGQFCSYPHATAACSSYTCHLVSCDVGYGNCDANEANGCETDLAASSAHCGACGHPCSASQHCVSGACVAVPGNCTNGIQDGQETDVDCGGPSCPPCLLGRHCNVTGDCGPAAQSGEGVDCANHVCACMAGWADCDGNGANGCEVGLGNDPRNCGTCGHACSYPHATATCTSGTCSLGGCQAPYGDCDGNATNGCETNLNTDRNDCGVCGHSCSASQECVNKSCVTPSPLIDTFTAQPLSYSGDPESGPVVLSWTVRYATGLSIDEGVGTVTGLTSTNVYPSKTTTYTLTATNTAGQTTRPVTVTIRPLSASPDWITLTGYAWQGQLRCDLTVTLSNAGDETLTVTTSKWQPYLSGCGNGATQNVGITVPPHSSRTWTTSAYCPAAFTYQIQFLYTAPSFAEQMVAVLTSITCQ